MSYDPGAETTRRRVDGGGIERVAVFDGWQPDTTTTPNTLPRASRTPGSQSQAVAATARVLAKAGSIVSATDEAFVVEEAGDA